MSQHKKTIKLLRRYSKNISFDEAYALLVYMGFTETTKGGSHCKFEHTDYPKYINLVRNKDLKGYLIEDINDMLEFFEVEEDV